MARNRGRDHLLGRALDAYPPLWFICYYPIITGKIKNNTLFRIFVAYRER